MIHTDPGATCRYLGTDHECGHVDFWPNKGSDWQPGCAWKDGEYFSCSHERALKYFKASIIAVKKCSFIAQNVDNDRKVAFMGIHSYLTKPRGGFKVYTHSEYHWCQGAPMVKAIHVNNAQLIKNIASSSSLMDLSLVLGSMAILRMIACF